MGTKRDTPTGKVDTLGRPIKESSNKKEAERAGVGASGISATDDFGAPQVDDRIHEEPLDVRLDPEDEFFEDEARDAVDTSIMMGRGSDEMLGRIFNNNIPDDFHEVMYHPDNWQESESFSNEMMETPGIFGNVYVSEDGENLVYDSQEMDSAADSVRDRIVELYETGKKRIS